MPVRSVIALIADALVVIATPLSLNVPFISTALLLSF